MRCQSDGGELSCGAVRYPRKVRASRIRIALELESGSYWSGGEAGHFTDLLAIGQFIHKLSMSRNSSLEPLRRQGDAFHIERREGQRDVFPVLIPLSRGTWRSMRESVLPRNQR